MEYRTETDSLGEFRVPADAYYGAQTARALANFPIGNDRFSTRMVHALGLVKQCAAESHLAAGALAEEPGKAIVRAADDVAAGRLDDHFPVPVWQTGSGTALNMNANEVIANRANESLGAPRGRNEPVHPNDHVNLGQSSNDVIPTAIHLAVTAAVQEDLVPALDELVETFARRRAAFGDVVKVGRTHLMDAVPLTFGQEISGWSSQVADARDGVVGALEGLWGLALGGTAVGTGLNAPRGFAEDTITRLAERTGRPFRAAPNRFAAQGAHDALVGVSGAMRTLAVALMKIAGDIRLLASGPRAGLGELRLPANEPGSSIMPGKVNPTQAEALHMVCALAIGLDTAVTFGGATGHLQLNANKPLLAYGLLRQIELLADASRSFARRCVAGMEPQRATAARHLERSLMLVTALAPRTGYDRAAAAAHRAHAENRTLREVVLEMGLLDAEQYDALVDPRAMTGDDA